MNADSLLERLRAHLNLDAEAEAEVLEELRGHLEDAVAAHRARGLDEAAAWRETASAFGLPETAAELRQVHAGRGLLDGVLLVAVPVVGTLVLRWLIFAPDGTAAGWRALPTPAALVAVAGVAMLVPLLRFPRRRTALALWAFFWGLSLATAVLPTLRW